MKLNGANFLLDPMPFEVPFNTVTLFAPDLQFQLFKYIYIYSTRTLEVQAIVGAKLTFGRPTV